MLSRMLVVFVSLVAMLIGVSLMKFGEVRAFWLKAVGSKNCNGQNIHNEFPIHVNRAKKGQGHDADPNKNMVLYASYASNMNYERFLCYIEGGKIGGMAKSCCGARDTTYPALDLWKKVPNKLFFGRSQSGTWGVGGVAFLNPIPNRRDYRTILRLYKITFDQFCDVLAQENGRNPKTAPVHVDWKEITALRNCNGEPDEDNKYGTLEYIKGAWYGTIKYLGDHEGLPILTITCSVEDIGKYNNRELPVCGPSAAYKEVVIQGLRDYGLTAEQAKKYLSSASEFPAVS